MIDPDEILRGKILIVDDRPVNILLLEQMLRGAGYLSIASTTNSHEVRRLHSAQRFDLILLDLQMPGCDGFEVMEDLKSIETGAYLPVLVITAQPGHKLRALRAGARDFISKPFVLAEVLIRVHNLLEVRLLHAKAVLLYERAQAATRGRDDVLGIVAHDLRSPLNTIVTQLELIRRSAHDAMLAPVDHICRAAHHMERLIRDLLDVARLDAGRGLSMDHACVDPRALLAAAVELARAGAQDAGPTLAVAASASDTPVWADYARLLQVLDNLITNAIKFSARGGGIVVDAVAMASEVSFSVSNTGAGIPSDHLPHVFERFWQKEHGDRRGAGLGLAIVQGIVESLGGRVWAESTLGVATTFFFTVPIATPERRTPSMRLELDRDRFTLLVVDDDHAARMALQELLVEEGYHVLEAANAASALELFGAHGSAIDLLLTDVRLGATDGLELAQQVRSIREIPIVFMTGLDASEVSGGSFISKPIDLAKLLELLAHELGRTTAPKTIPQRIR